MDQGNKTSENTKEKHLEAFEVKDSRYVQSDIHSLILICVDDVTKKGEDCTFERLVYECFTEFPKTFSLFRYPEWPDSNKLDRPLRKLREKGLIVGSPKVGFSLTEHGKHHTARVRRMLEYRVKVKRMPRMLKGKEKNFVAYMKSSEIYQRFKASSGNWESCQRMCHH